MLNRLKALYPVPAVDGPVPIIHPPEISLRIPPNPTVSMETVRSAFSEVKRTRRRVLTARASFGYSLRPTLFTESNQTSRAWSFSPRWSRTSRLVSSNLTSAT